MDHDRKASRKLIEREIQTDTNLCQQGIERDGPNANRRFVVCVIRFFVGTIMVRDPSPLVPPCRILPKRLGLAAGGMRDCA